MSDQQVPQQPRIGIADPTLDQMVDGLYTLKATVIAQQQVLAERDKQLAELQGQLETLKRAYERLGGEAEAKDARIAALESHTCPVMGTLTVPKQGPWTPGPGLPFRDYPTDTEAAG